MRLNSFANSPRLLQFYKKKNEVYFEIILFFENVLSMSLLKVKSKPKDQSSNQNKQKKVWSYLAISRGVATGKGQGAMPPPHSKTLCSKSIHNQSKQLIEQLELSGKIKNPGKIKNRLRIFQGHFGRILKNRKPQVSDLCNSY